MQLDLSTPWHTEPARPQQHHLLCSCAWSYYHNYTCTVHVTKALMYHYNYVYYIQANTEIRALVAWRELPVPQPLIVVRGCMEQPADTFLAVDRLILCKIKVAHAPLALLAAFYVYNIHYTPGYSNFFQLLECYFLDAKMPKRSRICNFMAELNTIPV